MELLHANELEAQRRLTDLYRDQATDVEKKYKEMQEAVTEMQEMLKQGHERKPHLRLFLALIPHKLEAYVLFYRCLSIAIGED